MPGLRTLNHLPKPEDLFPSTSKTNKFLPVETLRNEPGNLSSPRASRSASHTIPVEISGTMATLAFQVETRGLKAQRPHVDGVASRCWLFKN